jgi:4-amino-4-deoxy-L-arabinose transferase-like glycosyltransferase
MRETRSLEKGALYVNARVAHQWLVLTLLFLAAVVLRIGVRMAFGESYFWKNSYLIYYALAENIVSGKGFCIQTKCAWLPPLYPLFLAVSAAAEQSYLLVVVPQALMGAGTAVCAFLIGRHIFNARVGILACGMTAFYPYYVVHDTALQETGMATFLTVLSIWLLLRASKLNRNRDWFLAGLALGSIALTRASMALVIAIGLIWCVIWGPSSNIAQRLGNCLFIFLAAILVVGPWIARTYHLTGAPVLNSQTGVALWTGNNPDTFSHYPGGSIDRSRDEAWLKITPADREKLDRLADNEIATSNWFARRALVYMRQNPWTVVQGMARKLEAGFSWRLNPYREPLAQTAYSIAYVPVVVLGFVGILMARGRREIILIGMLFLGFVSVTAVFWAHTSHRSYLDVYLIVCAASVVERILLKFERPKGLSQHNSTLVEKIHRLSRNRVARNHTS